MNLIPATQWLAPGTPIPGAGNANLHTPARFAYIHHTAGPTPSSPESAVTTLRSIDNEHRRKGWNGIGYSFIVDPFGNVYEGRGQRLGAHTEGLNSQGFGICFLGNFEVAHPAVPAMVACTELIHHLRAVGALVPTPEILGHRDTKATACPGKHLYAMLPDLRAGVAALAGSILVDKETNMPETPTPNYPVNARPVSIAITPSGNGYIILCADGGVFTFGDAKYLGRVSEPAPGTWK